MGIPELNIPVVYPEVLRAACPPSYHDLIVASPFQERGKRPAGIPIAQDAAVRRKCAHLNGSVPGFTSSKSVFEFSPLPPMKFFATDSSRGNVYISSIITLRLW